MKANQVGQTPDPRAYSEMAESDPHRIAQTAHGAVDRFAEAAMPAAKHVQDKVNASVDSLSDSADRVRQAGVVRAEGLRAMVRDRPLVALATAAAIGLLVARIAR